jgi:hypothetical protein
MSRFTERHLDPASRLGEILFGFIMVLSVTLTAGFNVVDGKRGVRQLLLAAVGANVAWGIIDAAIVPHELHGRAQRQNAIGRSSATCS